MHIGSGTVLPLIMETLTYSPFALILKKEKKKEGYKCVRVCV